MLLLAEGDRTCEECRGTGFDCEYCENGLITERQNPSRPIDLAWWNEFGRSVILAERFRGAIARRGCEGRGILSQRHLIGPGLGGTVEMRTVLPSGPVIALPWTIEITKDNATEISHETIPHQRFLRAGSFAHFDGTTPKEFKGCDLDEVVAIELSGTTRKLRFRIAASVEPRQTFRFQGREYVLDEVTTTRRTADATKLGLRESVSSFVHARHEDSQPSGFLLLVNKKASCL